MKGKIFKHLIFLIIPVLCASIILTILYVWSQNQYRKFAESGYKVEAQLKDLNDAMVAYKGFKGKVGEYKEKGIAVEKVASSSSSVATFIKSSEYSKAKETVASYSAVLDDLYNQKQEEIKKHVEAEKVKFDAKMTEYKGKGVGVADVENEAAKISDYIGKMQFDEATKLMSELSKKLDELMVAKQEADKKKAEEAAKKAAEAAKSSQIFGASYQAFSIGTNRGNFNIRLIKIAITPSLRIITDTGDSSDCGNGCTAKPLGNYVSENGGFAGINGTYFCPPDYGWCAGKTNTYDNPVFNSRIGKLINADKLFWDSRSMLVFDASNQPHFFAQTRDYNGIGIKAAISNMPGLVNNKQNICDSYGIDDKSRNARITRNGIGVGSGTIYLVSASGATVPDLAAIFMALGVDYALNLDGGGSAAMMYNGQYVIGPGRALPNAIVFGQ